jgi:hypothetical protein
MEKKSYTELKNSQPVMHDCFFAFCSHQVAEGIKKHGLEGKKLYDGGMGLIGTREGIKEFLSFYDNNTAEIAANCNPQEVYDYEFGNHECEYTQDDTEAIKIVAATFGDEIAKTVKRRNNCVCVLIENLKY